MTVFFVETACGLLVDGALASGSRLVTKTIKIETVTFGELRVIKCY